MESPRGGERDLGDAENPSLSNSTPSRDEVFNFRDPLIIPNSSLPRRRESSYVKNLWIPAFAGMTFLEVAFNVGSLKDGSRNRTIH
jgi:hypothetical protein